MSVAKVSEISATSTKSFEDAIQQGLDRAAKTLRNIRSAWIKEQHVRCDERQDNGISGQHDGDVRPRRLAPEPKAREREEVTMGLRDTYAYAIQTAKGKFHGNAEERDGKLHFKGTVATEAEKNEIWMAIKTIPTWQKDIVADIQVTGGPGQGGSRQPPAAAKTYTVKAGDTLSKIAKEHLGNASAYMKIFEREQGSADRSRQDQARTGAAPAVDR